MQKKFAEIRSDLVKYTDELTIHANKNKDEIIQTQKTDGGKVEQARMLMSYS